MKHDWIRFRLVLPLVFGLLAARADDVGLSKTSHGWIDGDGLGYGPAVWPYQAIYLLLFTINRSRICSVNANPQAAEHSNASLQYGVWFPAIVGWWSVDWHSNRFRHPRSPEHSMCKAGCPAVFPPVSLCFCIPLFAPASGEFHWWNGIWS